MFLLKRSVDFQGGYSHPVTEEHNPKSFFVEQGGAVFLQECLGLKVPARLLSVIMLHFPQNKNFPSESQWLSCSFLRSTVLANLVPGWVHTWSPVLGSQEALSKKLQAENFAPQHHSHTFKDNCSVDFFSLANWDSHRKGWLWALHPNWPAEPVHIPGLFAEAKVRDFLSPSSRGTVQTQVLNAPCWLSK